MKRFMNRRSFVLMTLLVLIGMLSAQDDPSHRLYLQAKKYSFEQKWLPAAELFSQLVKEYPKSPYREEADFWIGYCLEKAGETLRAYEAFEKMQTLYSGGAWQDDAMTHQIILAEKLAQKPGDRYYAALQRALDAPEEEIRLAAATALARLGDQRALPVLKSLRAQPLFDSEAERLLRQLEMKEPEAADDSYLLRDEEAPQRRSIRTRTGDDPINFFQEHRFEQYRSLTRKDDNWTHDELIDFAMWHILPTDQFDEYLGLDRNARVLWLESYWKQRDPTPTTPENECRDEFELRVAYARSQFNYYDGRKDFYYAPWDARGEIYLKFGRPERRTISDGGEFWHYPAHRDVTFFIRPHVTNVFGRSIFIASLDNRTMRSAARPGERLKWRNFHNEYIFQPGFYFTLKTR